MVRNIVLLLMGISLVAGCYTMVKHPVIQDQEDPDLHYNVYFSNDCSSCHSVPLARSRPNLNYINNSPRWSFFYQHPWWQREVFYQYGDAYPDSGDTNGGLPNTSARPRFPGANSGNGTTPPGSISSPSGGTTNTTRISGAKNTTKTGGNNTGSTSGRRGQTVTGSGSSGGSRSSGDQKNTDDENKKRPNRRN